MQGISKSAFKANVETVGMRQMLPQIRRRCPLQREKKKERTSLAVSSIKVKPLTFSFRNKRDSSAIVSLLLQIVSDTLSTLAAYLKLQQCSRSGHLSTLEAFSYRATVHQESSGSADSPHRIGVYVSRKLKYKTHAEPMYVKRLLHQFRNEKFFATYL